ncbi:MAG: thioredoxin domain-containing protein [Thermoflexaceae bacterium]|nr:thioredoxin domain-containing protein [Thermoflexaceae bacterium]
MKVAPAHERPGVSFPRSVALALVALAIVAIAAACSSDGGDGPDPSGAPAATSTPSSPADPSAAFRALEFPADLVDGQAIGKPDARITLTAFEDFQCPFCLRFTLLNEPVIIKEYVLTGRVRFEFKHLPILGDESGAAAIAGSCAADQGRFWALHKRLFLAQLDAGQLTAEKVNVGRFSAGNLQRYAAEEGLDGAAFAACLGSQAAVDKVTGQLREATALGLRGTPSFLINGQPVPKPPTTPAEWRSFLDEQLKTAR